MELDRPVLARLTLFPSTHFSGTTRKGRSISNLLYDGTSMKSAPSVPGDTEAERMKNAVRIMFSVPKDAYLKEETRLKRARARKRVRKAG